VIKYTKERRLQRIKQNIASGGLAQTACEPTEKEKSKEEKNAGTEAIKTAEAGKHNRKMR
jgi:hypothetical protein